MTLDHWTSKIIECSKITETFLGILEDKKFESNAGDGGLGCEF